MKQIISPAGISELFRMMDSDRKTRDRSLNDSKDA